MKSPCTFPCVLLTPMKILAYGSLTLGFPLALLSLLPGPIMPPTHNGAPPGKQWLRLSGMNGVFLLCPLLWPHLTDHLMKEYGAKFLVLPNLFLLELYPSSASSLTNISNAYQLQRTVLGAYLSAVCSEQRRLDTVENTAILHCQQLIVAI